MRICSFLPHQLEFLIFVNFTCIPHILILRLAANLWRLRLRNCKLSRNIKCFPQVKARYFCVFIGITLISILFSIFWFSSNFSSHFHKSQEIDILLVWFLGFFLKIYQLPVFMWRSHITKWKTAFPSEVLVSSNYRPYTCRNLAIYNISAQQGSSFCNRAHLNLQALALRDLNGFPRRLSRGSSSLIRFSLCRGLF